jgi:curved DNA-binding protein CbpA
MIDYFALLDQTRAPWLDPANLKEVFRQRTLAEHPDSQRNRGGGERSESTFLELNEAYQVLSDPKRRLHHLLTLEGHAPSSSDQTIPKELHDLFPEIGALSQKTKKLLEETRSTSNALSRALLKPRILEAQNETAGVRKKIQGFEETALTELHQINESWVKNPAERIGDLSNLYFVFAYLNRWSAQLDEMAFQLSLL